MTTTTPRPDTLKRRPIAPTWRGLLRTAALLDVAVMVIVGVALRDLEAILFGGVILVALTMLRFRTGLAGAVVLGVVCINAVAFMAPATVSNLTNREEFLDVLIPASVGIISLAGAAAAFGALFIRQPSARIAALVPQVLIGVFVLAVVAALVQQRGQAAHAPQPTDVATEMRGLTFVPDRIEVDAGEITFAVTNTDLFWHTFTIDEFDLNLTAPTRGSRRGTVTATSGTYEFYCAVPGHRQAGMKGTLVVR